MNDLAGFYNQEYYEKQRVYTDEQRYPMACLLAQALKSYGDIVLDVGCAKGYLVKAFRAQGANCTGFDISEYAIKNAVCQGLSICDAENRMYPYPARSFDLITSFECMEHLKHPENAVKEMARVIKPYGCVAIASPKITWRRKLFKLFYPNPKLHPSELTFENWYQIFFRNGFYYRGDFIMSMPSSWHKMYRKILYNMTYPMPPQTFIGKMLHRFNLDTLRARLNTWFWEAEFMMFQKVA